MRPVSTLGRAEPERLVAIVPSTDTLVMIASFLLHITAGGFADDLESPCRALFTLQHAERISSPPFPLRSNLLNATRKAALDHLFATIQNHFSVFSLYLHPVPHAIFPLAGRAFDHSCLPDATASYRYEDARIIIGRCVSPACYEYHR